MPVSKRTRCIASTPNSRRFLLLLSSAVIARMKALTSEDRVDVLIVDDSLYSRNRSKKVELAARVFDHAAHRFVKGFRMLTLGWSDGTPLFLSPSRCSAPKRWKTAYKRQIRVWIAERRGITGDGRA